MRFFAILCLCYARRRLYLHFLAFATRFFAFALQRESALRRCASIRIYALANRRAAKPLRFFAILCLCIAKVSLAYHPCLRNSMRICALAPLRLSFLCHRCTSRCPTSPLPRNAMPLRCIAERRVSALRPCDALPPTPRPALPLLFDTRPCIAFALLIKASLIQAIYAYLRRCSAQLNFAFALRCTAVTTVPLLSKLVSTMPLPSSAHISAPLQSCYRLSSAFANHIIAVADQISSMQCRCSVDDVKGKAALAAVSPLADAAQNAVVQPLQNRILERFVHEKDLKLAG